MPEEPARLASPAPVRPGELSPRGSAQELRRCNLPDRGDEAPRDRKGLLGFYITMGAVLAIVIASVWLTPLVRLHYYAWQYREHKESQALNKATQLLLKQRASPATCTRLLGEPKYRALTADGERVLFYGPRYYTQKLAPNDPFGIGRVDPGARLEFHSEWLVSVEPFSSNAIPDEVLHVPDNLIKKIERQSSEAAEKK